MKAIEIYVLDTYLWGHESRKSNWTCLGTFQFSQKYEIVHSWQLLKIHLQMFIFTVKVNLSISFSLCFSCQVYNSVITSVLRLISAVWLFRLPDIKQSSSERPKDREGRDHSTKRQNYAITSQPDNDDNVAQFFIISWQEYRNPVLMIHWSFFNIG